MPATKITTTKSTPTTTTKATTTKAAPTTTTKVVAPVVNAGLPLVNKEKAIESINHIFKYIQQKQSIEPLNILEENSKIFINFETDKYYHNVLFKPYHIVVPNQIEQLSSKRTLVLIQGTKDNAIDLKTKLVDLQFSGAVDILSMKEFKKIYVTPELKIKVRKQYDEFIVDSFYKQKIQNLFGKEMYLSNQSPKKVDIDINEPTKLIEMLKQLDRMVLIRSFKDLFFTIPVGTTEQSTEIIVENVAFIVKEVISKLPENINSIQSLSISAADIRFPFYVNVNVPKNILYNSKKQLVELPITEQSTNTATPATTTTPTPTKNNKKRSEPEPTIEPATTTTTTTPTKSETVNKKSKTTPVKEVIAKPTTPAKETPVKKVAPVKAATPVKVATPVKEVVVKTTTPVKETPVKKVAQVKAAAPVKVATPVKEVVAPVVEEPKTVAKKETPVKKVVAKSTTPVKVAAPVKEVVAPVVEEPVVAKKAATKVAVKKSAPAAPTTTTTVKKTPTTTTTTASKLKKPVEKRA